MREHLVMICRLGATVLAFMTVYAVCGRHPPRKIVGGIREVTGMLAVKSAEVPFIIRLERFVEKNGAKYHFGKKVSAKKLILLSLILFATGLIVGNMISVWVAAAASIAGLLLLWILIPFFNRSCFVPILHRLYVRHPRLYADGYACRNCRLPGNENRQAHRRHSIRGILFGCKGF